MRFGSWTQGMDADPGLLDRASQTLGVPMEIASIFRGPGDSWPYETDRVLGRGRTLLVSWHLGEVAGYRAFQTGRCDALVAEQAARLRDYGGPVVLRPWAEMNADWADFQPTAAHVRPKPCGGGYGEFIGAWQRVVRIFRSEGASNVSWAFNPTIDVYPETTPVDAIYPGDDYVDYLALDGYNWGDGDGLAWRSFSDIYAEQYGNLVGLAQDKPVWIAEIGCCDPDVDSPAGPAEAGPTADGTSSPEGSSKGTWWMHALEAVRTDFPQIAAIVFFDAEKERDWRIASSATALAGLRRALRTPKSL